MSTAAERKAQYEGSALQQLMDASGHEICPKCYCCDLVDESETCWQCGGFWEEFDDARNDGPYSVCDVCDDEGKIYWKACIGRCDENGEHRQREAGEPEGRG